jgi:hypothetical protein
MIDDPIAVKERAYVGVRLQRELGGQHLMARRYEKLNNKSGVHRPATAQGQFGAGFEDAVILPLVLIAVAAKNLFQATLPILIHILDCAFPILLQLVRFPLFTARIIGDGVMALLKWVVGCLPVSGTTIGVSPWAGVGRR